jgi:chorismate dehydratase
MPIPESKTITVGKIKYTNAWPIFHYFDPSQLRHPVELVTKVPAELNRSMLNGSLDISAMSSFAYASGAEDMLLLPDLSVSADGPVQSIFLFSRKPLDEIKNGTIALTNTSATSVNLLKILMQKAWEGQPSYFDCEPDLDLMLQQADAGLLIGDHAIKASWRSEGLYVTDLGEQWKRWTGYSITFAVWAVRRAVAEQHTDAVAEIAAAFRASKQRCLSDLTPVITEACKEIGGTPDYWERYFTNLCYDFGEKEQKGLELYFQYAYELGLLDRRVKPHLWSDNTLTRVKE